MFKKWFVISWSSLVYFVWEHLPRRDEVARLSGVWEEKFVFSVKKKQKTKQKTKNKTNNNSIIYIFHCRHIWCHLKFLKSQKLLSLLMQENAKSALFKMNLNNITDDWIRYLVTISKRFTFSTFIIIIMMKLVMELKFHESESCTISASATRII